MPDYSEEIAALVRSSMAPRPMADKLSEFHEKDIAAALDMLEAKERAKVYRLLKNDMLSGVIEYSENRVEYLGELELARRVAVLSQVEISLAAEYLDSIERGLRVSIIGLLPEDTGKELSVISSFKEDEVDATP